MTKKNPGNRNLNVGHLRIALEGHKRKLQAEIKGIDRQIEILGHLEERGNFKPVGQVQDEFKIDFKEWLIEDASLLDPNTRKRKYLKTFKDFEEYAKVVGKQGVKEAVYEYTDKKIGYGKIKRLAKEILTD